MWSWYWEKLLPIFSTFFLFPFRYLFRNLIYPSIHRLLGMQSRRKSNHLLQNGKLGPLREQLQLLRACVNFKPLLHNVDAFTAGTHALPTHTHTLVPIHTHCRKGRKAKWSRRQLFLFTAQTRTMAPAFIIVVVVAIDAAAAAATT